jgi:hypothetical protein
MSIFGTPAMPHVPTLTEVIDIGIDGLAVSPEPPPHEEAVSLRGNFYPDEIEVPLAEPLLDETELVRQVVEQLRRDIELLLEGRLREALSSAPQLMSEALMHEVRGELAMTLCDSAERAVVHELRVRQAR